VLVLTGNLLKDPDFTMGFHRGDLLADVQGAQSGALKSLRRPPVVLDATLDAVIRALEQEEKLNAPREQV
jgi:threonine synthase